MRPYHEIFIFYFLLLCISIHWRVRIDPDSCWTEGESEQYVTDWSNSWRAKQCMHQSNMLSLICTVCWLGLECSDVRTKAYVSGKWLEEELVRICMVPFYLCQYLYWQIFCLLEVDNNFFTFSIYCELRGDSDWNDANSLDCEYFTYWEWNHPCVSGFQLFSLYLE